jgi:3D (Asp-Asp-Asp) domain-containing protein
VTAYCTTGTTASGTYTSWGTVAATLPFGTHVYIPGYGAGTVLDRGGAVGPGHVDVYMPSCGQAIAWGTRIMNIQILE